MEAELARELKAFRKQFKRDHGRDPSRRDMDKHPAIATTYDAWIAVKSGKSASTSAAPAAASTSAKKLGGSKQRSSNHLPHQSHSSRPSVRAAAAAEPAAAMGPPPTTPSKKKSTRLMPHEAFQTPTKTTASPSDSVHDSGGSVVDVPLTPKQAGMASPSLSRKHRLSASPNAGYSRFREYDDGGSPSKLRALISSFSSIQQTPKKKAKTGERGEESDRQLMRKLTEGPAYTPRTKARKRLRGEVVITPEKPRQEVDETNQAGRESDLSARGSGNGGEEPKRKKRRGMGMSTLKDFGMVPIAGPRSRMGANPVRVSEEKGASEQSRGTNVDGNGLSDDDDDDDMLGPSPSVNRVVDRPVKSFRPLFGVESNGHFTDGELEEEDLHQREEIVADVGPSSASALPSSSRPRPPGGKREEEEEDDEEDLVVRPYQRYERGNFTQRRDTTQSVLSDEEEDTGFYGIAAHARPSSPVDEEEDDDVDAAPVLHALTLNSPQCKRARNLQRIKAEREVRLLLGGQDDIKALEWEVEGEEGRETAAAAKTNKVGPPVKGGKLRKGFKDVKSAVGKARKEGETSRPAPPSSSLIFANQRDQVGSSEDEHDNRSDGGIDDDDEWASDIDSAEYGLGDGYMSDTMDAN